MFDEKDNYFDDLTINLTNTTISDMSEGFINNDINPRDNNQYNIVKNLKKVGVIKKSYGFTRYNYSEFEYVKFDLKKLKEYDINGLNEFSDKIQNIDKTTLSNISF